MKKVLFIGHDAMRTGAPLLLLNVLKWLREHSDLSFEVLLGKGGALQSDFEALTPTRWITHRGLITRGQPGFSKRAKHRLQPRTLAQQLAQFYPASEFPLIYSNTVTNGEILKAFGAANRRTIICHAHEMSWGMRRWGGEHLQGATQLTDLFIAASGSVRQDLHDVLKVPLDKIRLIHAFGQRRTMTDDQLASCRKTFRKQLGFEDHHIVIGACGTIDWRKGADLLPQVVVHLRKQDPERRRFRFLWIGAQAGSLEYSQLTHDLDRLGLSPWVTLVGSVTNAQEYFSTFDLFALLSREDPFPLVMLESAALGVPVVYFERCGGADELIARDAGIPVPYMDVEAYAKAIAELADDDDRRKALGRMARTKSGYTLETQAPKILEVIKEALAPT